MTYKSVSKVPSHPSTRARFAADRQQRYYQMINAVKTLLKYLYSGKAANVIAYVFSSNQTDVTGSNVSAVTRNPLFVKALNAQYEFGSRLRFIRVDGRTLDTSI